MGNDMSESRESDIHCYPNFPGEPEHDLDPECWCDPELEDHTEEGGARLFIHRRPH
jgi:hypothetical protein